jgi:hypothetical protein
MRDTDVQALARTGAAVPAREAWPEAAVMSWSQAFDDPIKVSDSRVLRTLRDAGHYVTALSKADQVKTHWQTAAHELIMSAERGGILMLAEIAMRQALAHGQPKPAPTPRKKAVKKYKLVR